MSWPNSKFNPHSELHDMSRQLAQYMEARITAAGVTLTEEHAKVLRAELIKTADRILGPNNQS